MAPRTTIQKAETAQRVRIIGIDPGLRKTGYGLIEKEGSQRRFIACGVIKADPKQSLPQRIKEIHDGVAAVVNEYQPQYAAVEDIFMAMNPQSALKLGQARGAIIIALLNHKTILREYTAKMVKQAVAGYGQASKAQVQHMVRVHLGLTSSPSEDAADGLAAALCFANHLDSALEPIT